MGGASRAKTDSPVSRTSVWTLRNGSSFSSLVLGTIFGTRALEPLEDISFNRTVQRRSWWEKNNKTRSILQERDRNSISISLMTLTPNRVHTFPVFSPAKKKKCRGLKGVVGNSFPTNY